MDLRNLETFMKVCDLGSFTAAADVLQLTQPGVSKQVQRLEAELGVTLLQRRENGLQLTEAGRETYHAAKEISAQWQALVESCRTANNTLSGQLRLGASSIPSKYLLPQRLSAFRRTYPGVELSVDVCDSQEALDLLYAREVEIAGVGSKPVSTEVAFSELGSDQLVIVAGAEFFTEIPWVKAPFLLRESGSGTRRATQRALTDRGISMDTLRQAAQTNDPDLMMNLVESGVGLAVVSSLQAEDAIRAGKRVRIVEELSSQRSFYLVWLRDRDKNPLVRAFIEIALPNRLAENEGNGEP